MGLKFNRTKKSVAALCAFGITNPLMSGVPTEDNDYSKMKRSK